MVTKSLIGHGDFAFLSQMAMNLRMFPAFLKKFLDYLQASDKLNPGHIIGKTRLLRTHVPSLYQPRQQSSFQVFDFLNNMLK